MRHLYPNHEQQLQRLNRIEGQIKGIRKMIEERRYCIDILAQIRAVCGAMEQVQMGVLEKHLHHCVRESVESANPELFEDRVDEILMVLSKMT